MDYNSNMDVLCQHDGWARGKLFILYNADNVMYNMMMDFWEVDFIFYQEAL